MIITPTSAASQFAYSAGEDFGSAIRGLLEDNADRAKAKAAKADYEAWMTRAAESGETLPNMHQRTVVEDALVVHVALKIVAIRELTKLDKNHPMAYSNVASQRVRDEIGKSGLKNFNLARRPKTIEFAPFAPTEDQVIEIFKN